MQKKHKAYLIFSIVFWLLVITGLILFGLAFGKVHINKYGLLRNYYSSWIDNRVYIAGLYHIGIGCYFVEFPASKVYLSDLKLNVTNSDKNTMEITYSLVYRIVKDQTYNLYQELSTNYEASIISTINVQFIAMQSIVSAYFIDKSQQNSRVTLQPGIVTQIIQDYGKKIPILKTATQIEAFWLNEINFLKLQSQYDTAYVETGAISQAFSTMDIQLMKTNMQVQTMYSLLDSLKNRIILSSNQAYRNATLLIQNSAEYKKAQQQLLISNTTKTAQIFEYYPSPKIQLF